MVLNNFAYIYFNPQNPLTTLFMSPTLGSYYNPIPQRGKWRVKAICPSLHDYK